MEANGQQFISCSESLSGPGLSITLPSGGMSLFDSFLGFEKCFFHLCRLRWRFNLVLGCPEGAQAFH